MHHSVLIIHVEDNGCGRAVQKVDASLPALPIQEEAAHAAAGNADQVVVSIAKREKDQIDQSFAASFEVTAETQEALAMAAECIKPHGNRPAVWPQDLVAFVFDPLLAAVPIGITSEYDS
jgi:hypothetical protein